ncbi:cupin domain-containing protein [Pseudarthrobacter sulfonivorans]|uniref:(R)-mandelonitrile lyase n=1 Tax=Pseudarthrobacter sulfonivorans TaxID=121292 RepID=UPI00285FA5AE|nr:cupin domain-containing protein [Pseudarthrobacter sulfonivorans]MDR6414609.1 quercetin dioxygenase-like cupin family protein [Pseudarthrobacter sulfonivorans]
MKLIPPTTTARGPAETFTGDVYVNTLHNADSPSRLVAAMVRFTPGARTNWHSHPLGQTLHCTDGTGLVATRDGTVIVIRPGDTVHTPPGEEHWHGATADSMMCHLALLENDGGKTAIWLEPVSGREYAAAQSQSQPQLTTARNLP